MEMMKEGYNSDCISFIVSMEKIPVGVTRPRRALLDRDGLRAHAVFKHVVEEKKMVRDPTATGRHPW